MDAAEMLAKVPVNRFLGLRFVGRGEGRAELELPVRAEFVQEEGVIHGGIVTALADTAAVYVLWPDLPPDRALTGIVLEMNFLAAAFADRGPLRAAAKLLRGGKTIAVCESEVFQGETLVAKGTFTFLQRDRK